MKAIKFTFFLLIFASGLVFGQKELSFEFDFARFKYDLKSDYLEFYYELNPNNMIMVNDENGKLIEAIVHIEMKEANADTFFINKDWRLRNVIADSLITFGISNLSGVFGFVVPVGKYSLTVKVWDSQNTKLSKSFNETLTINPIASDKFSVSDIQLANNIKREGVDKNSIFYKNTLEVTPNPSMLFTEKSPVAFFYAELYNLKLDDPETDFTLERSLLNNFGNSVYKSSKIVKQADHAAVEIGVLNLAKYPTDSYNLVLTLIDNKSKQAFVTAKRFYLYNPGVVDSTMIRKLDAGILGSEFNVMTMEECDKMFAFSRYIASKNEADQYKSLDSLNAKREFLYRFWKNRDFDTSTPQNEFQINYMKRVDYTNRTFKYMSKEGFQTDRGRIYLTYGEPDQRDYYPSEPNLKPYEIWFYNQIEGGVTFIFGDITGFGNYELLNSTKRGEVRDDEWMRRISTQ